MRLKNVYRHPHNLPNAYIQGPCPHHYACPRLYTGGPVLCNFNVTYSPLDIGEKGHKSKSCNFSYIILRKGKKTLEGASVWPRIIQPLLKRRHMAICRFCCPDGSIKSVTLTKGKHKGNLYKLAKHSEWGDLLPLTIFEEEHPCSNWDLLKRKLRAEKAMSKGENLDEVE